MARDAFECLYPGLRLLAKRGVLVCTDDISWRKAQRLQRLGVATIKLFHNRWQATVEITSKGREIVAGEATA